jgi:hypothetical protein
MRIKKKKKKEKPKIYLCQACGHVFEEGDAEDEVQDDAGNWWPECPKCETSVRDTIDRDEPPVTYLSIAGTGSLHLVGKETCSFCPVDYPVRCKCGGLIHKEIVDHKTSYTKCETCKKSE